MTIINSKGGTQELSFDGESAGEGLAIYLSQQQADVGRWRFQVYALTDQGPLYVGEIYSSPPGAVAQPPSALTRLIATAVVPGTRSWQVLVSCIGAPDIPRDESADVILSSSKCYMAPAGLSRVGQRYKYSSNSGTQNFTVLPGMVVTGIAALGLGGGGQVTVNLMDTITVPASFSIALAPEAPIAPNSVIAFTNVDWIVEYLESA